MKKTNFLLLLLLVSNYSLSIASDSTIVFMRSSFVGSMIKASIYDISDNETKFIGILKNNNKIEYKTNAGKHKFMVVSEAADFMEAQVEDGKTYYSIITPRTGAWKARFSMIPVKKDGSTKFSIDNKKFNKIMKKVKTAKVDEKSLMWYQKHKDDIEKKRTKYWKSWQEKSAEDIAMRTLSPEDGI